MMMQFHDLANVFPLIEGDEFAGLVADIGKQGLLEAIVLLDGKILDGRNRYRACVEAGVEPHFEEFDGEDPVAFVVSKNVARRHLDESQRALAAARIATLQDGQKKSAAPIGAPHTQSEAGDLLNVGRRSVQRARDVLDQGEATLVKAVEQGKVSVSAAADVATLPKQEQAEIVAKGEREILEAAKRIRLQKAEVRRLEIQAVSAREVVIPDGKYGTIVIDPPWQMEKIERDVAPNQVAFDYPTMTEQELAAFPVPAIAADDCHLFCWTTHKFLPMSLRLLDAWGFRYVLTMVWHKPGGFQPFGLPQYNCEFAVYARRGTPTFADTKAFNVCFQAPRREHSRKPDEFYDVIRRVTAGPRIDVFSRENRDGFDVYGNEAGKFAGAAE
jgi:N6-adenosine-specific RNA methylase IME4/ParB-like chromosome segregation protein Spo0J